jgi:hypothetical protein
MSAILASILIDAAAKVGAPIVKQLLEKHVGGAVGDIGGMVIDAIAGKAGVTPDELQNQDPKILEKAVRDVEAAAPELIVEWNVQQRQAIELMRAEMDKSPSWWTWGWRPAWMWFLGFLFLFRLVLMPLADAILGSSIAGGVDLSTMMTLTAWFMGLYMGGHTVKDLAAKWAERS